MTDEEIKAWIRKIPYIYLNGKYLFSKKYKLKDNSSIELLKNMDNCIVDDKKMEFYMKRQYEFEKK